MTSARSIRTPLVLLLLGLSVVAALSVAGSASAGLTTKCGQQVLADWYDNGRIDKLYPLNCYEEAIDEIPSDIGPYVDAEDVITRALQGALHGADRLVLHVPGLRHQHRLLVADSLAGGAPDRDAPSSERRRSSDCN